MIRIGESSLGHQKLTDTVFHNGSRKVGGARQSKQSDVGAKLDVRLTTSDIFSVDRINWDAFHVGLEKRVTKLVLSQIII